MAITNKAGNATLEVNGRIDSAGANAVNTGNLNGATHQLLALVVMRRTLVQQI
ncbi:MAG: hypothetical protein NWP47_01855 [Rickettsiaceae bacterium]|nr:hypothetical protein [Rickettsiaceae bacterium]